ncbi:hypothetical protein V6N11_059972 [Hibiscus sabdariffa]|uniref:Uncharacterized protein n=1 Tax=Hibiscus sabdariffa TaxID=183260 RepID=A0ABR2NYM8_9ROSI
MKRTWFSQVAGSSSSVTPLNSVQYDNRRGGRKPRNQNGELCLKLEQNAYPTFSTQTTPANLGLQQPPFGYQSQASFCTAPQGDFSTSYSYSGTDKSLVELV